MPRLRRIDVRDYAADDADLGRGEVVERVTAAYQSALADSGLQNPASWVSVTLFPLDGQSIETVSVLVHCDKPDGQEIIRPACPPRLFPRPPGRTRPWLATSWRQVRQACGRS